MCYEQYLVTLQMLEMLVATSGFLVTIVWHLNSPCLQSLDQEHHHKWLRDLLSSPLHRQDLCTLWTVRNQLSKSAQFREAMLKRSYARVPFVLVHLQHGQCHNSDFVQNQWSAAQNNWELLYAFYCSFEFRNTNHWAMGLTASDTWSKFTNSFELGAVHPKCYKLIM